MCVAIRHVWALRILTKTKRPGAISTSKSLTEKTPTTKTPNKKHQETSPVAQNLKLTTKQAHRSTETISTSNKKRKKRQLLTHLNSKRKRVMLKRNLMGLRNNERRRSIMITSIDLIQLLKMKISLRIMRNSMICQLGRLGLERIRIDFLSRQSRSRVRIASCRQCCHQLKRKSRKRRKRKRTKLNQK